MPRAQSQRAAPHARIYTEWTSLPAWRALSFGARSLLVDILAHYRPAVGRGRIALSAREAGARLGVSKASGARFINELELNGWIDCAVVSKFGRGGKPGVYRLAMYLDEETRDAATFAFKFSLGCSAGFSRDRSSASEATRSHRGDNAVSPISLAGTKTETVEE